MPVSTPFGRWWHIVLIIQLVNHQQRSFTKIPGEVLCRNRLGACHSCHVATFIANRWEKLSLCRAWGEKDRPGQENILPISYSNGWTFLQGDSSFTFSCCWILSVFPKGVKKAGKCNILSEVTHALVTGSVYFPGYCRFPIHLGFEWWCD